ncbi:MAG: RNA-binding cell elongation regulator Jag/EloR [Ilumatobacteraceae bacterium]|jgi:spoIIIJ-associated protein
MQWVETTGRTIDEAKSIALDQLGVADDDAEFEILEEPKAGLFGRTRGEARVRARVRPRSPRPKVERRDRRRGDKQRSDAGPRPQGAARERRPREAQKSSSEKGTSMSDDNSRAPRPAADPATVAAEAEKFLVGLTSAFGVSATASSTIEGDEIEVAVDGNDLGLLVGPRGATLQAVQDITRVVSQRRMGDHDTRLRVDVGGYRAKRKEALSRFVNQVADEVVSTGTARALEPMPSADRKVIHDALTGRTDISTHSEGEDPYRRVIIAPADSAAPSA